MNHVDQMIQHRRHVGTRRGGKSLLVKHMMLQELFGMLPPRIVIPPPRSWSGLPALYPEPLSNLRPITENLKWIGIING